MPIPNPELLNNISQILTLGTVQRLITVADVDLHLRAVETSPKVLAGPRP